MIDTAYTQGLCFARDAKFAAQQLLLALQQLNAFEHMHT